VFHCQKCSALPQTLLKVSAAVLYTGLYNYAKAIEDIESALLGKSFCVVCIPTPCCGFEEHGCQAV
jgi:hypothetical protein